MMKFRNFSKKWYENFSNEFGSFYYFGFGNLGHHGKYELPLQLGILCDDFWSGFGGVFSVSRAHRGLSHGKNVRTLL